jgi:Sec-independent protein translocase protein TatA
MSFFGIGGLEFLVIFGIALFVVGPRRLAEGVRTGRKYYTELKRQREELTSLVSEALEVEELKKDLKQGVGDVDVRREVEAVKKDLTLDQGDLDIGSAVRPVAHSTLSRSRPVQRGDGRIDGQEVPTIDLGADARPPGSAAGGSAQP